MHLQLHFNLSSHLFYLHDLRKSQTYMASCVDWGWGGGLVSTPGVFSCHFLSWKKMSCKKVVLQEQHPLPPPLILSRSYFSSKEANSIQICVNKNM